MEEIRVQPRQGAGPFDWSTAAAEFERAEPPHPRCAAPPHDRYVEHTHAYDKTLICLEGSIVFHVPGGPDLPLTPGDRLVLPAGTPHSATVGPEGVRCVEAHGP
jgi:quercetin dioxygenase-like cupin family protein